MFRRHDDIGFGEELAGQGFVTVHSPCVVSVGRVVPSPVDMVFRHRPPDTSSPVTSGPSTTTGSGEISREPYPAHSWTTFSSPCPPLFFSRGVRRRDYRWGKESRYSGSPPVSR